MLDAHICNVLFDIAVNYSKCIRHWENIQRGWNRRKKGNLLVLTSKVVPSEQWLYTWCRHLNSTSGNKSINICLWRIVCQIAPPPNSLIFTSPPSDSTWKNEAATNINTINSTFALILRICEVLSNIFFNPFFSFKISGLKTKYLNRLK